MTELQTIRVVNNILENKESPSQFQGFGVCKNLRGFNFVFKGKVTMHEWGESETLYQEYVKMFNILSRRIGLPEEDLIEHLSSIVDTQFYTPKEIIDSIVEPILEQFPDTGQLKVLEPSAGMGYFVDSILDRRTDVLIDIVEKDDITAYFLRLKYGDDPRVRIHEGGFENLGYEYRFDLVVSNIPFGNQELKDSEIGNKDIESFFFEKSARLLESNGISALITGTGFLKSSRSLETRSILQNRYRMIEVGFLPHELFQDTFVHSNLVVFQNQLPLSDPSVDLISLISMRHYAHREQSSLYLESEIPSCLLIDAGGEQEIDLAIQRDLGIRGYGLKTGQREDFRDYFTNRPFGGDWEIHLHYENLDSVQMDLKEKLSDSLQLKMERSGILPRVASERIDVVEGITADEMDSSPREAIPLDLAKPLFKSFPQVPQQLSIFDEVRPIDKVIDFKRMAEDVNARLRFVVNSKTNDYHIFYLIIQRWDKTFDIVSLVENEGVKDLLLRVAIERAQEEVTERRSDFINVTQKDMNLKLLDALLQAMGQKLDMRGSQVLSFGEFMSRSTLDLMNSSLDQFGQNRPSNDATIERSLPSFFVESAWNRLSVSERVKAHFLGEFYTSYIEWESKNHDEALRETLIEQYEHLTRTNGYLNQGRGLKQVIQKIFQEEDRSNILSLEIIIGDQIFPSHVLERTQNVLEYQPKNIRDAFLYYLSRDNFFDIERVISSTGASEEEVLETLSDKILFDATKNSYLVKADLLRGNLYDQMERYEDKEVQNFIRDHIPKPIPLAEINPKFGERWLADELYSRFINQLFDTNESTQIHVKRVEEEIVLVYRNMSWSANAKWSISSKGKSVHGYDFAQRLLKGVRPPFNYTVEIGGQKISYVDKQAIAIYEQKKIEFDSMFRKFVLGLDEQEKAILETQYNRLFNANIRTEIHQDHSIYFDDMFLHNLNDVSSLRPHQIDGVRYAIARLGGLMDHEVGTGKTLQICLLAHELIRLKKVERLVIVLQNPNIAEIVSTYKKVYPNDRILYPSTEDFGERNRETFIKRIDKSDYTVIFLNYNQFQCLPVHQEVLEGYLQERIDHLTDSLIEMRRSGEQEMDKVFFKRLQKRIEHYEYRLETERMNYERSQLKGYGFERLRIGHIIVDECHNFKNVPFETAHSKVKGLNTQEGSDRAMALHLALLDIQKRNPDAMGATLYSGTPISNSVCEIYTWARLLIPQELTRRGISSFDSFASTFFNKSYDLEYTVSGQDMKETERFKEIEKVPELAKLYQLFSHIVRAEGIGIQRPDAKVQNIVIDPDEKMVRYLQAIQTFINTGRMDIDGMEFEMSSSKAKMLDATNYMRQITTDVRLVNPHAEIGRTKIDYVVEEVIKEYRGSQLHRGTQIIFLDKGVPNSRAAKINLYDELKYRLIGLGVKEDEIAFIHSAKTDKQKETLYESMNQGEVRILIASRQKGGVGINVQRLGSAVHFVDIMWTPLLDEQARGRFLRQGNEYAFRYANNEVKIFKYGYKNSGDLMMLNTNDAKERIIATMRSNNIHVRSLDEGYGDEENGISQGDFLAELSGDDRIARKIKLEKEIIQLNSNIQANQSQFLYRSNVLRASKEKVAHLLEELAFVQTIVQLGLKEQLDYDSKVHSFVERKRSEELVKRSSSIHFGTSVEVEPPKEEGIKKEYLGRYIFETMSEKLRSSDRSESVFAKIGEELIVKIGSERVVLEDLQSGRFFEILSRESFGGLNSSPSMRSMGMKLESYLQDAESRQSSIERSLEIYQREIDYSQNFIETFQIDDKYASLEALELELGELRKEMLEAVKGNEEEKEEEMEV